MEQRQLHVEIATPAHKEEIGDAVGCSAPGVLGHFQVLENHAAMVSELAVGELKVDLPEESHRYAVSGGFLEVLNNRVLILLESAERAENIDTERARMAKDRAEKRLTNPTTDVDLVRAEAALTRAVNRLKVAGKASHSA